LQPWIIWEAFLGKQRLTFQNGSHLLIIERGLTRAHKPWDQIRRHGSFSHGQKQFGSAYHKCRVAFLPISTYWLQQILSELKDTEMAPLQLYLSRLDFLDRFIIHELNFNRSPEAMVSTKLQGRILELAFGVAKSVLLVLA
jgi:hypothetical protein